MDKQFLIDIKELAKLQDIPKVNALLKSGWLLLAIEQDRDTDGSISASYVLGRVEGSEE